MTLSATVPALPALGRWQYRFTTVASPGATAVGDRWLEVGGDLPVIPMEDADGKACGLLLGFPLDLEKRLIVEGSWRAPAPFREGESAAFAKTVLWALAGRYLAVFVVDGHLHLYPDSGARIPCVIDRETGFVASTATALLADEAYEARFRRELHQGLGVDGKGWFPAGLTAHRDVERLLPGFYLDAATGRMTRFWPATAPQPAADPGKVMDEIIALVRTQFEILETGSRRLAVALSGGRDTRMIFACARPYLKNADIVTVIGEARNELDDIIAGRITQKFGLDHLELLRKRATPAEHDAYIRRTGHCYGDSNSWFFPSLRPIADNHVLVGGNGGEFGRGYIWKAGDTATTPLTPATLAMRMGLPTLPEVEEALKGWLDSLPPLDTPRILDLAYLECIMAPWASAQFCADPGLVRQDPLMCWAVTEKIFSLPSAWKRNQHFSNTMVEKCWPGLAAFPYNSLGPWRDFLSNVRKGINEPGRIIQKLRKMRS